jgi:hypothetical protein
LPPAPAADASPALSEPPPGVATRPFSPTGGPFDPPPLPAPVGK